MSDSTSANTQENDTTPLGSSNSEMAIRLSEESISEITKQASAVNPVGDSSSESEEEKMPSKIERRKSVRWADQPEIELASMSSLDSQEYPPVNPSKLTEVFEVDYLESRPQRLFKKHRTTLFVAVSISIVVIIAVSLIAYLITLNT